MAVSVFDLPRGEGSSVAAATCLVRATLGLLGHGFFGFGRPAVIERSTGRVRAR